MAERNARRGTKAPAPKRTGATLRLPAEQRARLYEELFDAARVGVNVWRLEDLEDPGSFRFVTSNAAAAQISGVPREEVLGKTIAEARPGLLRTDIPRILAEVVRRGKARDLGEVCYGDERMPQKVFLGRAFPLPDNCVAIAFEDVTERKRAEEALRQSEAKFRKLAESAAAAVFIYRGTRPLFVNAALEELTGFTQEEILAKELWEFVHPDFQPLVRQRSRARQQGSDAPSRYEFRVVRRNGEERWVDFTATMVEFEGEPAALGTAYDITERKRAEEALRQSEAKFRKLAESTAAAVFIYRGTTPLFVNAAAQQLTGYSQEEMLAKELWQFVHPDLQPLVRERSRARQQGMEAPSRYEVRVVTKSGEERWVDFTATMIEFEGEPAALGTAYDITERKRAEDVLREREARYRLLADNVTDVIWTADLKLNLTFVSPSISQLTGHTAEEAMTLGLEDILTPGSLDFIKTVYAEEIAGPALDEKDPTRSRTLELEVYRKDRTTIWIEANMAFLRDTAGRPVGLLGVARDITERKRAEEALRDSEATYRTIFDAVSDAIVLHDAETGTILHVNARFCEMFGYTPDEARGLNVEAFGPGQPPYLQEQALRWIRNAVQGETRFPDWRGRHKSGRLFWVQPDLRYVVIGGRDCVLAVARDITERKREEEALRNARETLESKVERELQQGNPYGLTFRELTVLHLVAAGKTDRQVALELGISPLTVHKHLTNIFGKMGAASRTEAGVRALREGLLD